MDSSPEPDIDEYALRRAREANELQERQIKMAATAVLSNFWSEFLGAFGGVRGYAKRVVETRNQLESDGEFAEVARLDGRAMNLMHRWAAQPVSAAPEPSLEALAKRREELLEQIKLAERQYLEAPADESD